MSALVWYEESAGGFSQKEGAEGGEMHRWYCQPVPRGINHGGIMAALAQKRPRNEQG